MSPPYSPLSLFHPRFAAALAYLLQAKARGLASLALLLVLGLGLLGNTSAQTKAETSQTLRIGFQKSASLFVLQRVQGSLEKKLQAQGFAIKWVEFPAGPQLLEGLNVGAIDVGFVGEAPPIFAQAAGANFVYFGYEPAAPHAEAVLVTKDSPIQKVSDLKGKKVALNKGSNVHYLLLRLLEKNGLKPTDIQPIYLAPADGRAAFESKSVDAWAVWDPFQAAAEKSVGARVLADGSDGVAPNYQYYLGERSFVQKNPQVIATLFADAVEQGAWLKKNLHQAATLIAPQQGLPVDVVELALRRYEFNAKPLTPDIVAQQQKVADTFYAQKLIPKPIKVQEATVFDGR